MRIALVPLNPTIGAIAANAAKITALAIEARAKGADLAVFPELALTGYPPKDLLLHRAFIDETARAAKAIGESAPPGLTLVFGAPLPLDNRAASLANALLAYRDGAMVGYYDKRLLPTYDVFDEDRYFTPGNRAVIVTVAGVRVGLTICEDLWRGEDVGFASRYLDAPDPLKELVTPGKIGPGAQVIINPSASPFALGKGRRHLDLLRKQAVAHGVFVAAVNQLGANDELIFDGQAAAFGPEGQTLAESAPFDPAMTMLDLPAAPGLAISPRAPRPATADLFAALTLGIRDYCRKTGFTSVVLGLSGGIDSAVCAVLAAAALGPDKVLGLSMPSRYSSDGSRTDARDLASNLGTPFQTISVEPAFEALRSSLNPLFAGRAEDVTEENLQSRIRGTLLMAASNKFNHLLLTTGNKSEMAVGYCTLYGDMNGGLAVLSDVTKIMVYALARWMNEEWASLGIPGLSGPPIPEPSITKPPSAELRPNQTDQDSLPPYHILDEIIERYVERHEPAADIARDLHDEKTVARIIRMINRAEFKRKQAPIGLKVTSVAFGSGRRMPIAQAWI